MRRPCRLWHRLVARAYGNGPLFCFRSRFLFYGLFPLLLFLTLLVWQEECRVGYLANLVGNFFVRKLYREIEVVRTERMPNRKNISIVVVVDTPEQLAEYPLAQSTLHCYSTLHDYPLVILALSEDEPGWQAKCPQTDLMFRRHCMLAHYMAAHPSVQFVLFLDADMGVINPNHLLEEFLHNEVRQGDDGQEELTDMVFYERTFNGEIMAGSYFARNCPFSIQFLHYWANYFFRLPNSFHGTDNGAIHTVFMDVFCGDADCSDQRQICSRLWNASSDFSTLLSFTVCARNVLGSRNAFFHSVRGNYAKINVPGKVRLLTDFRKFWARDGWLTANCWSERDFIFHGWKEQFLDKPTFARWHSPLVLSDLVESTILFNHSCSNRFSAKFHWPYKDSFMRSEGEIAAEMEQIQKDRKAESLEILRRILL